MGGNSHHALADRVGVKYCLGGSLQLFEDLCGYLLRCEGSLFQDFLRLRILALPDVFRAAIFSLFDFERPDCTIILHIWVVELSADDPFGSAFDSTFIYAPINEANYYVGLRYTL